MYPVIGMVGGWSAVAELILGFGRGECLGWRAGPGGGGSGVKPDIKISIWDGLVSSNHANWWARGFCTDLMRSNGSVSNASQDVFWLSAELCRL